MSVSFRQYTPMNNKPDHSPS